ncbi:hypothetical protein L873DRAFT_1346118 [Choiromyces venosus 120613-1]|uniref:Uncharacterized protein n=1 Tax=Choiromyces venosus 120613-1 TaxID=1336337 RepID=A0A3N4K168_9PEZI|nr:hypothetical protein L873DRAFT_1346118 [Choiromyces venosus 120613-1]
MPYPPPIPENDCAKKNPESRRIERTLFADQIATFIYPQNPSLPTPENPRYQYRGFKPKDRSTGHIPTFPQKGSALRPTSSGISVPARDNLRSLECRNSRPLGHGSGDDDSYILEIMKVHGQLFPVNLNILLLNFCLFQLISISSQFISSSLRYEIH